MKPFKFLKNPIATAHDGGYIYAGETFYTMNKEEFSSITGRMIPKYTIVRRYVGNKFATVFKPDYDSLWYFRSEMNAEYLRDIWERQDRMTEGGEIFHNQSDITITFNR